MSQLKAIIIDDEARSRNTLRQKINNYCPGVTIIEECESGDEGIISIENKKPDIVFLDVEMPRMNGFVMLQSINDPDFEVIFTTAYDHYAVKAIRFSALDYLVKPIEVEELKQAVERARIKRQLHSPNQRIEALLHNIAHEKTFSKRIVIPSAEGLQFVDSSDIIYLEAESNYSIIYLETEKIIVSRTLKDFEELLPSQSFFRIHHSYIVNKAHVKKYVRGEGGQVVMSNGKILQVSRRKKDEFIRDIGE